MTRQVLVQNFFCRVYMVKHLIIKYQYHKANFKLYQNACKEYLFKQMHTCYSYMHAFKSYTASTLTFQMPLVCMYFSLEVGANSVWRCRMLYPFLVNLDTCSFDKRLSLDITPSHVIIFGPYLTTI